MILDSVQYLNSRQRELAQSASRPTRVRYVISTRGTGETRMDEPIKFPTFIIGDPTFTYGVVADQPIKRGEIPLATAIVLGWEQNDRGMYVGAFVGFVVDCIRETMRLKWTLTFEGFGLRTTSPITDSLSGETFRSDFES